MKKILNKQVLIFSSVLSSILVFFTKNSILAYEFSKNSGVSKTGGVAGYETGPTEPSLGLVNIVFPVIGVVFLLLVMYGGYLWMTAQGNSENVEKGKKIIVGASIGLAIILCAYAITYYFISTFQAPTMQ